MMTLTAKYKSAHYTGLDCRITNLRNLMQFYGTKQSYSTIYGMSAGLDFAYRTGRSARDIVEHPDFNFPTYFRATTGSSFNIIEQLAFNYGACIHGNYPDTPEASWLKIRQYLSEGMPVMLAISRLVLSRFLGRGDGFPTYLNGIEFGGHWVVITDIDEDSQTATIFDTDMVHPFRVPLNVLDTARTMGDESDACLMKSRNRWVLFIPPQVLPSRELLLRTALSRALYHMTGRSGTEHNFLGLTGLEKLAEDMPTWPSREDMSGNLLYASAFIFYLNGVVLSSGMGRRLYASFLRQAAVSEKSPSLQLASDRFTEASEAWGSLLNCVKQCLDLGDFKELPKTAKEAFRRIIPNETAACESIASYLHQEGV